MEIPATEIEGHNPGTRFNQPPRHQEMFQVSRGTITEIFRIPFTIAFADGRIFLREVKRINQSIGCQDIEHLLIHVVHALHGTAGVGFALELVKGGQ